MFKGSIVALVTPMMGDHIDIPALCALVDHHILSGTDAIVAAGTTGEAGTLTQDEKLLVLKTVIDHAANRIPVIAGTAANSTAACIELTQKAMAYGADAVLIMTPAYIRPTQEGLYQHYRKIAESVAIPIILYNVSGRTGCDLLPETVGRLASISNIIGIKEAFGNNERLQQLMAFTEQKLDVFSGDDLTAAEWVLAGAKGVISVTANVAPKLMAECIHYALRGMKTECLNINEQLMPLHRLMFVESNPIPAKWAVSQQGFIQEDIRLPLTSLTPTYQTSLAEEMRHLKLL